MQWPLPPERPLRTMRRAERESAFVRVYEVVKHLLGLDPVGVDQTPSASLTRPAPQPDERRPAVVPLPGSAPQPKRVTRFDIAHRPMAVGLAVASVLLIGAAGFRLTGGEDEPQVVAHGDTTTSSAPSVTPSSTPVETPTTRRVTPTDPPRDRDAGSGVANPGGGLPPSTAPPSAAPLSTTAVPNPSPPAEAQGGQWTPRPTGSRTTA